MPTNSVSNTSDVGGPTFGGCFFGVMFGDFAPERRDEENWWFDTEHVPQRLLTPGFTAASRYELATVQSDTAGAVSELRYLNFYVLDNPGALHSDSYARQSAHVSPRAAARQAARTGTFHRGVWSALPSAVTKSSLRPTDGPSILYVEAFDVSEAEDAAAIGAAVEHRTAQMQGREGVLETAAFDAVEVQTPGSTVDPAPRLLILHLLASPEAITRQGPLEATLGSPAVVGGPRLRWQGVYQQRPSPWTLTTTSADQEEGST
jgi:hypothetical protein